MYSHVNDVYLETAAYTGVRYSISDVISDQPALSCNVITRIQIVSKLLSRDLLNTKLKFLVPLSIRFDVPC